LHGALLFAALAAVYFAAGKLGLTFATLDASASAIWPPTGIALAAFLVLGARAWPAVLAGAFAVNVTTSGSAAAALAIAVGNTLEGWVGAWLVARLARGPACFERAGDVFRFAVLAAGLATTISATIGTASVVLLGSTAAAAAPAVWLTWWLGDASGALVFTPPLVLWYRDRRVVADSRLAEAVVALAFVLGTGALCFATPGLSGYPLAFLCLPPLAWVAFRFGPRAVSTHVAVLSLIAVYTTGHGVGPFVAASRHESLLVLQAFMATIALTMLPIAALAAEHARARAELERANIHERRARREAETASRAKDDFMALLSHELRNPLQAIASSLWLLERHRPEAAAGSRAVDIVRRQADHLTRVVNDLLDVGRLATGKVSVAPQAVNLALAVRRNVQALQAGGALAGRAVEIEVEPLWLRTDPGRLDEMLANLLDNAARYAPPGSRLRVSARREDNDAVVRVTDNGAGVPAQLLPDGLEVVRHLARLHGGREDAANDSGPGGAEFVMRLPVEGGNRGADAGPPAEPRHVLIVEDNADVRLALRTLLEQEGHLVDEASDGALGVEAAARLQPDVVLVDIAMPGMDGYEVARRLRARFPHLRLMALTGYGQAEDRRRARAAGFDEHLVKPIDPAALARALGEAAATAQA
jgi:signal transduction histidine kinase/CheY-like chemotaxis protein